MTGLVRSTVSPSSSSISRSTPWVDGCWGPMLMIMVSSSGRSTSMSPGSSTRALGQAQHRARLAAQLVGPVAGARRQLLGALGGLGQPAAASVRPRTSSPRCDRSWCVARSSALIALGASLNCTGTRPTP